MRVEKSVFVKDIEKKMNFSDRDILEGLREIEIQGDSFLNLNIFGMTNKGLTKPEPKTEQISFF